jgi:hypothetical protein
MNKNQIQDRNYHGKDIEKTKTIPNQYPHGIARVQDFEPLVRYERWPQGPNGNGFKIMSFRTKREIYSEKGIDHYLEFCAICIASSLINLVSRNNPLIVQTGLSMGLGVSFCWGSLISKVSFVSICGMSATLLVGAFLQ